MSIYSAADENNGNLDRFVLGGGIENPEKQALCEKYLETGKQTREEPDKENASCGNFSSIANMERIDYMTLLAEQMNM